MKRSGRVTQKDVALELGLTPSAVSRAMRNDRSIPQATCRRVKRKAAELGYRPDPEISKMMGYLRQSRSNAVASSLGLLNLHAVEKLASINRFTRRLYDCLVTYAGERGYSLSEFNPLVTGMQPKALTRMLRHRGIDGLIIPGVGQAEVGFGFDFSKFSAVTIGYSLPLDLHRACQDQFAEMRIALRELTACGYRRPGLVLSNDADLRANHHYSAAFLSAFQEQLSAGEQIPLLIQNDIDKARLLEWLKRTKPDVLLSHFTRPSTILSWLSEAGVSVPGDLGYACLDLPEMSDRVSGIFQNYDRVAKAAIDLLVGQINGFQRGLPQFPRVVSIHGSWVHGGTTCPAGDG